MNTRTNEIWPGRSNEIHKKDVLFAPAMIPATGMIQGAPNTIAKMVIEITYDT
jgi:hypothetical protein